VRSAELDRDATAFLDERSRRTAAEFGLDLGDDAIPQLEWGQRPEFRTAAADGRPTILVAREDADWWRIRYQIAHEVFHWLCTPPGVFHWTHELLAVETAVRAMEELGEHDYVERTTASLAEEAERLTLEAMLTTSFREVYPDGLYGRAWVTGRELISAVGWEALKPLARSFDESGAPSVFGWMRSLDEQAQEAVQAILGTPSSTWI
jgi:hypothetical protein